MKRLLLTFAITVLPALVRAQEQNPISQSDVLPDSVIVPHELQSTPDSLSFSFAEESGILFDEISDNPLYFQLFMPLVLYKSAVSDGVTPENSSSSLSVDSLLTLDPIDPVDDDVKKMINEALLKIYLEHPELVKMTEQELRGVPAVVPITSDLARGINVDNGRARGVTPNGDNNPETYRVRPHYWALFGNFQGKYTQSYYSDNWYKGGESNRAILSQIVVEANYARKQTNWDNKLEMKLGYYTTEIDGEKKLKTNEDLLRLTSKFGLKAWDKWNYTAQFQGYTQFMPVFDTKNPAKLKSKFFSPAYGNLSIGMDYKPKFKNKDITLSMLLSPLSYDCRYVGVDSIATNFGIKPGHNFMKSIGSRVDANFKWKFLTDFTLTQKAYYYTSYERVEVNFESTLDYRLSKYFSLQMFLNWRYDDSTPKRKDEKLGYSQLREFLTINFRYDW